MEGAPLRAVPLRPTGPVDPAAALAHVSAALPELDEQARRALALVELGGAGRYRAAGELALDETAAAAVLARGRKALRRSLASLPATGWCERAEGLISDRLDGELAERAAARLHAHLENCERCVTHERRLDQARDRLVRTFLEAGPEPAAMLPEPPPLLPPAPVAAPEPVEESREETRPPSEPELGEPPPAAFDAAVGLGWHLLFAIAVLLMLAALVVVALGIAGVDHIL